MSSSNAESLFPFPGWFAALVGLVALAVAGPGFRCHCSSDPGRILDMHLAARVDWEHHVVAGRAHVFSPLEHRFVLVVTYRDLAPDSEVRLKWRYLGGATPKIFRRDLRVLDGSGRALFGARKDKGVWPPGPYDVVLELSGRTIEKLPFSVSSRTSYRFLVTGMAHSSAKGQVRGRIQIPTAGSRLRLSIEALNPKPGTRCRVIWKRRGAEGGWTFYGESESVPIRSSGLVPFELPRPEKGYCVGTYRAEARIGGRKVASLEFELVNGAGQGRPVRRGGDPRSPGGPAPREAGSPAPAR